MEKVVFPLLFGVGLYAAARAAGSEHVRRSLTGLLLCNALAVAFLLPHVGNAGAADLLLLGCFMFLAARHAAIGLHTSALVGATAAGAAVFLCAVSQSAAAGAFAPFAAAAAVFCCGVRRSELPVSLGAAFALAGVCAALAGLYPWRADEAAALALTAWAIAFPFARRERFALLRSPFRI